MNLQIIDSLVYQTRTVNSFIWQLLPFDIADKILFEYLALIDDFIQEEAREIMYIHRFVVLPVSVTTEVRHAFYNPILMNIPDQVQDFVNGIRFICYLIMPNIDLAFLSLQDIFFLTVNPRGILPMLTMCNYFRKTLRG